MPLFSKARPRLTRSGHAYMPQKYKECQAEMHRQVVSQWGHPPLEGPIAVHFDLYGEAKADADNLIGAALDSLNGLVWADDRVSIIPAMSVCWTKAPKAQSRWVIQIAKL
jgi:Holliday junction resolvase RusA-like endonuclease